MILGVVIAGGKSTRMGGIEKAFQLLAGMPLIDHVIRHLAPQVDDIIINANGDPERFSDFGHEVISDVLTDVGTPLAGLHAGLVYAVQHGFSAIVTTPSDAPFLPLDLVARLQGLACIARSSGQSHYLTGYWSCELLPALTEALERHALRRVQDWANLMKAQTVEWSSQPFDPFFNINTPDDLRAAEQLISARA